MATTVLKVFVAVALLAGGFAAGAGIIGDPWFPGALAVVLLGEATPTANTVGLILAALLGLLVQCFGVLRWATLLRVQGLTIAKSLLLRDWVVGAFFGSVLPGIVIRDLYRLYASTQRTRRFHASTAALIAEKMMGLVSIALLCLMSIPLVAFSFHLPIAKFRLLVVMALLLTCSLVACVVMTRKHVFRILVSLWPFRARTPLVLQNLGQALTRYADDRGALLRAFMWSLAMQCASLCALALLVVSLGRGLFSESALASGALLLHSAVLEPVFRTESLLPHLQTAGAAGLNALRWPAIHGIVALAGLPMLLATRLHTARPAEMLDTADSWALGAESADAYRRRVVNCIFAGLAAGLIAGAVTGLCEAAWVMKGFFRPFDAHVLWWAPLAYGLCYMPLGLVLSGVLSFFYIARDRFRTPTQSLGILLGGTLAVSMVVVGRWRFVRDVLHEAPLSLIHIAVVCAVAVGVALAAERLCSLGLQGLKGSRVSALFAVAVVFALIVAVGAIAPRTHGTEGQGTAYEPTPGAAGPNLIFIVADTLRADFLPSFSPEAEANTPAIDALARDSVLFTQAFAQAPWTKSSFGTMWTGALPREHRATAKDAMLNEALPTFAEGLAAGGYYTAGLPNNLHIHAAFGFGRGFHEYTFLEPNHQFGASIGARSLSLYEVLRRLWARYIGEVDVTYTYQPAGVVEDQARQWLKERSLNGPFMLFLHFMDTHDPYIPAGEGHTRLSRSYAGSHPDPGTHLGLLRDAYIDEVERIDAALQGIVDELHAQGLYEDAAIVFTSDHGEEFFEHGGWWHGTTLYDEMVHVPLIIKYPGNRRAGTVLDAPVHHIDLAPTLLDLAGTQPPESMRGVSLHRARGQAALDSKRGIYLENTFEGLILQGVRTADAKLITNVRMPGPGNGTVELYDMLNDPGEQENRAGQNTERQASLAALLESFGPYHGESETD